MFKECKKNEYSEIPIRRGITSEQSINEGNDEKVSCVCRLNTQLPQLFIRDLIL